MHSANQPVQSGAHAGGKNSILPTCCRGFGQKDSGCIVNNASEGSVQTLLELLSFKPESENENNCLQPKVAELDTRHMHFQDAML
jgi:hypothetical protein